MKKLGCIWVLALWSANVSAATEKVVQPTSMAACVNRSSDRLFGDFVLLQQDVVSKLRPWLVGKAPVTAADVIRMRTPPPAGPTPQYVAQSDEPPQPIAQPPYWEQQLSTELNTPEDYPVEVVEIDPVIVPDESEVWGTCTGSCTGPSRHQRQTCGRRHR